TCFTSAILLMRSSSRKMRICDGAKSCSTMRTICIGISRRSMREFIRRVNSGRSCMKFARAALSFSRRATVFCRSRTIEAVVSPPRSVLSARAGFGGEALLLPFRKKNSPAMRTPTAAPPQAADCCRNAIVSFTRIPAARRPARQCVVRAEVIQAGSPANGRLRGGDKNLTAPCGASSPPRRVAVMRPPLGSRRSGPGTPALALALLTACLAAGCGRSTGRAGAPEPAAGVRDGLGRAVVLRGPPRRIVTLAPNATDTIAALGLGDRLVGVSDFCEPPPEAKEVRRIGGLLTPDLEAIRALKPDLLVGSTSGNDPGLAAQAEALGLPLFILNAENVAQVLDGIADLGAAIGEPARAQALLDDLRARLDAVAKRVAGRPRPRVL